MSLDTEQLREDIREQCRRSTYFLGKAVLGFTDMTPQLHAEMCTWIEDGASRKLGLVPRDHLKTSTWTIADTIRRICANPNIRILLGNETATNATHFLRRIQAVFMRNTLFQWLFPELIPDFGKVGKWSETEMLVPRVNDYPESTVEVIGVGGAVVSRHYNLIKLDDLVGKEASESAEVMKKTIDWYIYCESLLERPQDEIHLYGTRWGSNDVYSWAQKNEPDVSIFFRSAFTEGKAIWPERFSAESLEKIKQKMGSWKFNTQYMNVAMDPDAMSFKEEWLHYWDYNREGDIVANGTVIPLSSTRIFMRVDPAVSERIGSARSAIVVDAVAEDGRKFLLEDWAKRCHPFEMIDKIFEFQDRYNCESVGIEAVAYQRILKPLLENEGVRRGGWINVQAMRPDSHQRKENRILGVQNELERGLIWIRRDHTNFLEEYRTFPTSTTLDVLDAWAYGPFQWSEPMEEVNSKFFSDKSMWRPMDGRCAATGY